MDALRARKLHLGALVLNKVLPRLPARRRGATEAADGAAAVERRRSAAELAPLVAAPDGPGGRRAGRGGGELPQLPGGRQARGRAAGRAVGGARGDRGRALLRRRHPRSRPAWLQLGRAPLAVAAGAPAPICHPVWRRGHPRRARSPAHPARPGRRRRTSSAWWASGGCWPTSASPTCCSTCCTGDGRWLVIGQVRPATAQTLYLADWVGTPANETELPLLNAALEGRTEEGETQGGRRRRPDPDAGHPGAPPGPGDRRADPGVVAPDHPPARRAGAHLPVDLPPLRGHDHRPARSRSRATASPPPSPASATA